VRSASRRNLFVLTVEHVAFALSLVFGGAVLMLLLGTQILDWYWLVLLGGAGLIAASIRIRRRILTEYRVAQTLDSRMHLNDSLSTAWYLLTRNEGEGNPAVRFQLDYAEEIAGTIQPESAFPFRGQRMWALSGALAAVVFGLFAVRYLVHHNMNLAQALVPIHLGPVIERLEKKFSAENRPPQNVAGLDQLEQANAQNATNPETSGQEKNDVLGFQDPNSNRRTDATSATPPASQKVSEQESGKPEDGDGGDRTNGQPNTKPSSNENSTTPGGDQRPSQPSPGTKEQTASNQQSQQGLLDKMKDAMSSLMSKMRPNPGSQKSMQNNEKSADNQQSGQMQQANKDPQSQSQNGRDQQSSQDPNAQGQEQGQTTEKAQSSQGRNSDKTSDKNGNDARSGVGRQDGLKEFKEAEQQQAMGKLAEIIGKRSQSLTGDMMVETPSGKQQLKTQYSQRVGRHTDLGGEINRDEVPVMYQQYVREYMEQVRKQAKP
jgi:hypothetical protein